MACSTTEIRKGQSIIMYLRETVHASNQKQQGNE